MNKISAFIFDMDGVISDTQKLHAKVESDILSRFGISLSPEEITKKYAGVNTKQFFDDLLKNQSQPYDLNKLMEEKWSEIALLGDKSIEEITGSIKLIHNLYDLGYRLSVGSASNQSYVRNVIRNLNLEKYFEFLVSGDMVKNGKPDPEIFLLAASKMGVPPAECVVIEDGTSGMRAAKAAGMKCIGLVESKDKNYPTQNLILSLEEITPDFINNLI